MEAALECRIPFICHIREDVEKGLRVEFLNKKKHFDIVNYADDIIIISNFIKNNYLQYVPEAKVLYDGLDVNQYYLKKNILDSERINISIYGNLDEQKDQMVAVKAMEKLQKLHIDKYVLNIIGNLNTKYGLNIKKYIIDNNISNVNLIDNIVDSNKLKNARKKDDINLICSRAEGLGRVTIESMLSGNLTIGADAGATCEIIKDGVTGLLFKTGDSDSLAELLVKLTAEKEKMVQIAKNGQKYALEMFDIKKYTEEISKLYIDIYKNNNC